MHQYTFKIVNRTYTSDQWHCENKDRALAFMKFLVDDFMAARPEANADMKRLYAADFVVSEWKDKAMLRKWSGAEFLGLTA